VQQEALSRGLPLLVTPNAGGEDLVEPGVTGWLVPIRDPAALADRIAWFADHRDALPDMRVAARRMAASRSWADYTGRIIEAIDPICPPVHE
jgi:glycosyltransferase involved in cell wall biosynthesis